VYDQYLIPANTKRGKLIFGLFRPFDLGLFSGGVLTTFILVAFLPLSSNWVTLLCLAPAVITAFLVMPIPNYHNMLNLILEAYDYLTSRRHYKWKGWCYKRVIKKRKR